LPFFSFYFILVLNFHPPSLIIVSSKISSVTTSAAPCQTASPLETR
jgi:hypothetical protein